MNHVLAFGVIKFLQHTPSHRKSNPLVVRSVLPDLPTLTIASNLKFPASFLRPIFIRITVFLPGSAKNIDMRRKLLKTARFLPGATTTYITPSFLTFASQFKSAARGNF